MTSPKIINMEEAAEINIVPYGDSGAALMQQTDLGGNEWHPLLRSTDNGFEVAGYICDEVAEKQLAPYFTFMHKGTGNWLMSVNTNVVVRNMALDRSMPQMEWTDHITKAVPFSDDVRQSLCAIALQDGRLGYDVHIVPNDPTDEWFIIGAMHGKGDYGYYEQDSLGFSNLRAQAGLFTREEATRIEANLNTAISAREPKVICVVGPQVNSDAILGTI